jgi:uncharacterized damage-inducible protein DinB
MRTLIRSTAASAALLLSLATAGAAQSDKLVGDLIKDIEELEKKVTDLVKAMPEAAYAYRPGTGVRSTGEVVQHLASDNYFLPIFLGVNAPESTGIKNDYKTVMAYETRKATRDQAMTELTASFTHLKQAMQATTAAQLAETVDLFGQKRTKQQLLVLTVTHLHEHLGQLIAYARSNSVKPPWSN